MASAKKIRKQFQHHRKEIEVPGPEVEPHGKSSKNLRYHIPDTEANAVAHDIRGWYWRWNKTEGNCLGIREEVIWGRKMTAEEVARNRVAKYLDKVDWTAVGKRAIRAFLERHPKLVEIYIRDTKI